ncbi:MAG: NACHT domain-containing protein, partial [Paludibacter sp.]
MKKSKIIRIEELQFPKFKETVANLVDKLGYKDIQKYEDVIIASNTSPLSSEKYLFILFKEQLSGVVNIEDIKNTILQRHELHVSNVIYILSQFNISSGFESTISKEITQFKLQFIGRDRLIKLLDELYSDFWKHDDLALLEYEKKFCTQFQKDTEINKLKIFNDKYQKLLDIYIEPRITHFYEDKVTQTPTNKKVQVNEILLDKKPVIISGDAGTGKSTFLKKVGELLIEKNLDEEKKTTPVYLTANEIFEAEYLIEKLILKKIEANFGVVNIDEFTESYNIAILIDSIDELDDETQKKILHELQHLSGKKGLRYIIGTRNSEKIISLNGTKEFNSYSIEKFNNE